ncbi:MAG: type IV pilus assembly protein FimV, partial [Lysobacter sp.]
MKIALAIALALASAGAAALGLGQIEVKSRIGQPLLAEIPIISNDPAELEELRAGLASPETFARIGLQPPH